MNSKEIKLKLRENEVVESKTFMESAMVCQLAHSLNQRWICGKSYVNVIRWDEFNKKTIYSFHEGTYANELKYYLDAICITAIEWLNRHDIFVPGQRVITLYSNNVEKYSDGIYLGEGKALNMYGLSQHFKSSYQPWKEK